MSDDTRTLLLDTASRLFEDHSSPAQLAEAASGEFPNALWQALVEHGFHDLARADSGFTLDDCYAVLEIAGYHALPLPLAEAVLARRWWLESGDEFMSIGQVRGNSIAGIPCGRSASLILAVGEDGSLSRASGGTRESGMNLADEPRDLVRSPALSPVDCKESVADMLALARACNSAGAMRRILEMCLTYVRERQQFGRPLAAFQAIQHQLSVMAAEVAAASRAVDAAVVALGGCNLELEVAIARSRCGQAISAVTEMAHQVHGAMGFTQEHPLHYFTRRLWSWRDEYGDERYWQQRLGEAVCQRGVDGAWDFIATRE
jgi:acyl-CoA dehydrogenase